MSLSTDQRKVEMLKALEKTLGNVTRACRMVGIVRQTHYNWMEKDPDYREAAESVEDILLDFAEDQLLKQIRDGNTVATIFFLKTKGKRRGYVEKQELSGGDGEGVNITVNVKDASGYQIGSGDDSGTSTHPELRE